ncbi:hypothetical protein FA15DRAFT_672554 [Coprinopsis marcescibilis]|uniref:Uncharacterized protein n=1 Tax=Coprinopsis marcescibilis TaxID=230819 RepID=A0A5C3KM83_COPMA|nr:hypothetical protein FA15DRAFT_672554 [Coprinopsis marcescibilis]
MAHKYERVPGSEQSTSHSFPPEYDAFEYNNHDGDIETEVPLTPQNQETRDCIKAFKADARFHPPMPSPYARAALLCFMFFLFWLALWIRKAIWVDPGKDHAIGDENVTNGTFGIDLETSRLLGRIFP